MKIAASVLAAGLSTRFGRNKLLEPFLGKPLLFWSLEKVSKLPVVHRAVVVRREYLDEVRRMYGGFFDIIVNERPWEGLSSSIRLAVSWAEERCDGLLLLLGDQPLVSYNTLNRLLEEFMRGDSIVVAVSKDGTPVNPAIFHKSLFHELASLSGDVGAKEIILKHRSGCRFIRVDSRELVDVDDDESLRLAMKYAEELGGFK